jgi:hypothetical protein
MIGPLTPVQITLPPGRGVSVVEVPAAVARYIVELERSIAGWRASVERNRELRVIAEARAGRLARDSRR